MNVSLVGVSPHLMTTCSAHDHNKWEIVLNLEGSGVAVVGEKEFDFRPGTIICQPPKVSHYKTSPTSFRDVFMLVDDFLLKPGGKVQVFEDDSENTIQTLMLLALRIFHKNQGNSAQIVNSLYDAIRQLLFSWQGAHERNQHIEAFINNLITSFTDPEFNLSNAIKQTPYSDDHFRKSFKKQVGVTPGTYLMHLRIEYAKKLLEQKPNGEVTISDISLMSGFYDSHYFSRVFKAHVGQTPREFAAHAKRLLQNTVIS